MTFDEWLDEQELSGSPRIWRLMDDINSPNPEYNTKLIRWLKAAYEVGYEHRKSEGK